MFEWIYKVLVTSRHKCLLLEPPLSDPKHARPAGDLHREPPGSISSAVTLDHGNPEPPRVDTQGAQKVVKHDDAEARVHLWNERARQGLRMSLDDRELDCIRVCLLKYWKRFVARCFHHLSVTSGSCRCGKWAKHLEVIRKGAAAVTFAGEATWWDWPGGSALFFKNWPPEYQDLICDGLALRFTSYPPHFRIPQHLNKDMRQHH